MEKRSPRLPIGETKTKNVHTKIFQLNSPIKNFPRKKKKTFKQGPIIKFSLVWN